MAHDNEMGEESVEVFVNRISILRSSLRSFWGEGGGREFLDLVIVRWMRETKNCHLRGDAGVFPQSVSTTQPWEEGLTRDRDWG